MYCCVCLRGFDVLLSLRRESVAVLSDQAWCVGAASPWRDLFLRKEYVNFGELIPVDPSEFLAKGVEKSPDRRSVGGALLPVHLRLKCYILVRG